MHTRSITVRFETVFMIEFDDIIVESDDVIWGGWFDFGPSMDAFACKGDVLPLQGRHDHACFRLVVEFSRSPKSVDPTEDTRRTSFDCAITADYYGALHLTSRDDGTDVLQALSIPEPFMPDGFNPERDWVATVDIRYDQALSLRHKLSLDRLEHDLEHGPGAAPQREVDNVTDYAFDNRMTVDYSGSVTNGHEELALPCEVRVAFQVEDGLVLLLDSDSEGAADPDIEVPPSRNILLVTDECECRWRVEVHPDDGYYDLLWLVDGVPHTESSRLEFRSIHPDTGKLGQAKE